MITADMFQPDFGLDYHSQIGRLEEYGRFQQHIVLLEDDVRVLKYLRAIQNRTVGEVVVDVGAGTGVLSMIALKHGFRHAFLIEPSRKICAYARHLAAINGFSDRITIIESTLESMSLDSLPSEIDMIVSETLSSLLFGFGSWDRLPELARRLTDPSAIIPLDGSLYACLTTEELASRGDNSGGLRLLSDAGIKVDLFERTFRSGGNVYDKNIVHERLSQKKIIPTKIADFDFLRENAIGLYSVSLPSPIAGEIRGLLFYWTVNLARDPNNISIGSNDKDVTSWYPFYVPLIVSVEMREGEELIVEMKLVPIDAPYKYAFRFESNGTPVTNTLYW